MISVMNKTKWEEIAVGMQGLGALAPKFRVADLCTGYVSGWDGDWFYHFREGGYASIEWVELSATSAGQLSAVLGVLRKIHVPGVFTPQGVKVLGHAAEGVYLDYL